MLKSLANRIWSHRRSKKGSMMEWQIVSKAETMNRVSRRMLILQRVQPVHFHLHPSPTSWLLLCYLGATVTKLEDRSRIFTRPEQMQEILNKWLPNGVKGVGLITQMANDYESVRIGEFELCNKKWVFVFIRGYPTTDRCSTWHHGCHWNSGSIHAEIKYYLVLRKGGPVAERKFLVSLSKGLCRRSIRINGEANTHTHLIWLNYNTEKLSPPRTTCKKTLVISIQRGTRRYDSFIFIRLRTYISSWGHKDSDPN